MLGPQYQALKERREQEKIKECTQVYAKRASIEGTASKAGSDDGHASAAFLALRLDVPCLQAVPCIIFPTYDIQSDILSDRQQQILTHLCR